MRRMTSSIGRPPPNLDRPPPEAADGQWGPSPTLAICRPRQRTANADFHRASASAVHYQPTATAHSGHPPQNHGGGLLPAAVRGPVGGPGPIAIFYFFYFFNFRSREAKGLNTLKKKASMLTRIG
jgi:hypothetical protein